MSGDVREFLWAAEAGLPLIPIQPDDARPWRAGWQRLATTNLAKVHDWASRHEAMAVATGRACDVFDLEVEHLERLEPLVDHYRGPVARSARGGIHLYTKPSGLGCPRLVLDGVHVGELKGKGGTCTVPPSRRPKGRYAWIRAPWLAPLLPAPPSLLALVPPVRQGKPTKRATSGAAGAAALEGLAQTVARAERGNRNSTLFWAACRALESGLPVKVVARVLTRAAADAGLPADEVARTIESGVRHVGGG
jgi:hypothetical protein